MPRPLVRRAFRLAIRRADRTEADVDAELRFHLESRIEQLVALGWSRANAEAEARRRFGPSWDDAVRRLHRSGHVREERLAMRERFDSLRDDVRYAVRALRRAPRFTTATVLTLALGLGATTVVFSLVDHVVLRPLPFADPGRLVVVREVVAEVRDVYPTLPANASHFLAWRRGCGVCKGLAAIKRSSTTLDGDGDPQRLGAARVSANLFSLLGVRPALGRGFREEEDQPGRDRVVVLSDAAWRRLFGADPSVVGRAITLDGSRFEVIGILPPAVALPGGDALGALAGLPRDLDVYRPLALSDREVASRGEFDYVVLARLRPAATAEQARAQLDAITAGFAERAGGEAAFRAVVVPLHAQVVGATGRPLLLLLAAVGTVLLIVCVNLANLSLARHVGRQREYAVRVALGARRGRLARLALAESLVVALAGGGLGLLLAHWGLRALVALAPATLPRVAEAQLDGRVFGAAALLAVVVGLTVGALPAMRSSGTSPGAALKAGGRTATGGRSAARRRALFIAAQVACSTVLLVGTGLFLSSFVRVLGVKRGFDADRVLALDLALPGATYSSDARRAQFYERALSEMATIPGIVEVAAASALPLEGETWVDGIAPDGDARPADEQPTANLRFVSPRYFAAMGTPLRLGRGFTEEDRTRWIAVISERAARTLWPGEDAVGKRLRVGNTRSPAEVVGVAADVGTSTLEREGSLVAYLPFWAFPPAEGTVIARTTADAGAVTTAVRAALRRVDPSVPVTKVRTMAQVVSATVAIRRFQLGLLAIFAMMALVTASVGIYGVISQSLATRTGEMGVRMALGARPADVHRLVLREGLAPVALGLAVGIAGSLAVGRGIESLLFEVRSGDPLTLAGVVALLATVAVVACAIPARRASRIELAAMLRLE
ncbi:MAG TPA: ABC transporter permease [Gemmatimonadaceae bacterium]|nr:ABC transporter permease [Gemmatimonadaceae bacterium]